MRLAIDINDVPEEKRDAKFEEELLQFKCSLRVNTSYPRWLFRLALHEGAHWRYGSGERTMRGPQIEYRDGDFKRVYGSIVSRPKKSWEYDFVANTWKEWLAGPLAVSVLTGQADDPEPDILAACKYLDISRDKAIGWICVAEYELREEFRDPVIVGEILDAARMYANAIFHDDSCDGSKCKMHGKPCVTGAYCTEGSTYHGDFCVDWGIKRHRLIATMDVEREAALPSAPAVLPD